MIRRHDWLERLHTFLANSTVDTFEWGRNDCVLFTARCVEELTGENPLASILANWTDEDSAKAALEIYGGLRAATTSVLGPPMDNPLFAQRGDVALTEVRGREFLAIHLGYQLIGLSSVGLVHIPTNHVQCVWAVGR
jgi:hypothetical protein